MKAAKFSAMLLAAFSLLLTSCDKDGKEDNQEENYVPKVNELRIQGISYNISRAEIGGGSEDKLIWLYSDPNDDGECIMYISLWSTGLPGAQNIPEGTFPCYPRPMGGIPYHDFTINVKSKKNGNNVLYSYCDYTNDKNNSGDLKIERNADGTYTIAIENLIARFGEEIVARTSFTYKGELGFHQDDPNVH